MLTMVDEDLDYRPLVKSDRCDRCGARAYARAYKDDAELLFCGHHGTRYLPALTEQGFTYQDDTERILLEEED